MEVDHNGDARAETESMTKVIEATSSASCMPSHATVTKTVKLKNVVDEYLQSKRDEGSLQQKGLEDLERRLTLLVRYFGASYDISKINLKAAECFRNLLMQIPTNMNNRSECKRKTLQEIANLELPRQSPSTVKGIVEKCSTFFNLGGKK
ncbi:hypothetical protein AB4184_15130 [Vibrio splendidus]